MQCSSSNSSSDYAVCRRLLRIVANHLMDQGTLNLLQAAVDNAKGSLELPSLSLFSEGGKHKPVTWMLPKVKCDEATLVYAYEAFVAQPLGVTPNPGKVAEQALNDELAGNVRRALNRERDPRAWFTPAARLVAMAQFFDGAEVFADFDTETFSANIGGAFFMASPSAVYSNYKEANVHAALPPTDVLRATGYLQEVTTRARLIVALGSMLASLSDARLVLRGLLGCIEQGVTTEMDLLHSLTNRQAMRRQSAADPQAVADLALQTLSAGGEDLIRNLYQVVVPTLYTSREFVRHFGSTSAKQKRRVRDPTIEKWAEMVTTRANLGV